MGHVYSLHQAPLGVCGAELCTPTPSIRNRMPNVRVVVEPQTDQVVTETVTLEDGSYKVSVAPGRYKLHVGFSNSSLVYSEQITVPPYTCVVQDFEIPQG